MPNVIPELVKAVAFARKLDIGSTY